MGLSHADDPGPDVAGSPDDNDHRDIGKPDRDESVLAIVPSVILNGQRRAREHLTSPNHVQPSRFKRGRALGRVELNLHNLYYYDKSGCQQRGLPS